MKKLNRIFFRSFMLQAVWNYETMQTLGFLYTLYPSFKKIYKDNNNVREIFKRHMDYFNTHPYMALFVMGEVLRLEESYSRGSRTLDEIALIKKQLGGPLAALGDKIFWSTWRPLTGLLGVIGAMVLTRCCSYIPLWMIPAAFLVIYNAPVIYFKIRALKSSYLGRTEIVLTLKKINRNILIKYLPVIGLILISIILIMSLFIYEKQAFGWYLFGGTIFTVLSRSIFNLSATRLVYLISLLVITGNLVFNFVP
ncbi:MAG: PTS system mannose/fructose/sorbose family transporter subunit IID [Elusimicrobiota bacterium]|nr:PTS system mannose/fructose/sorbose family transporter subunit IID [Elusimicrobiota bacterium]